MELVPGLRISPNLSLVRKLGQGGMGTVWLAEHLTLHTQVAVKFISAESTRHPGTLERFNREAAIAAQMKHPHAVQVLDHGISQQGAPFMAMELLEGEDLRHRIDRHGRLGLGETSHIIGQTCRALARAHSIGLVHRDIKPDNIFLIEVDGEMFVKVLDFGIARQIQSTGKSATATGAMLGTPYYMSPEQTMSAKQVDAKADLWSLAVVAYHCITGVVPFDGDPLPAVFVAIVNGKFTPPGLLVPGLPPAVDAWFEKALAHDPHARFSSAKELADSFSRVVGAPAMQGSLMSLPEPAAAFTAFDSAPTRPLPTLNGAAVTPARTAPLRRTKMAAAIAVPVCVLVLGVIAIARPRAARGTSEPLGAESSPQIAAASSPFASQSASAAPIASPSVVAVPASALPLVAVADAGLALEERKAPKGKGTKVDPGKVTSTPPQDVPPSTKLPKLGL